MNKAELLKIWKFEEQQPFTGWDFSYLEGRMPEERPDWSYSARAAELLKQSSSVLDLDTGGAERFLKLREYWPRSVVTTEHYPPNFKLATERLSPFDAEVIDVELSDLGRLTFPDAAFDLVLNRHGSFNPEEVARVLIFGGTFLTQQIHGLWAVDLLAAFASSPQWPDATPEKYLPRLKVSGLEIVGHQDWSGALSFTDVGAIVYYLKAVPWLVPGFSVESHANYLFKLQRQFEEKKSLTFTAQKYLMEARKPIDPDRRRKRYSYAAN